jgi:hypothetical protein
VAVWYGIETFRLRSRDEGGSPATSSSDAEESQQLGDASTANASARWGGSDTPAFPPGPNIPYAAAPLPPPAGSASAQAPYYSASSVFGALPPVSEQQQQQQSYYYLPAASQAQEPQQDGGFYTPYPWTNEQQVQPMEYLYQGGLESDPQAAASVGAMQLPPLQQANDGSASPAGYYDGRGDLGGSGYYAWQSAWQQQQQQQQAPYEAAAPGAGGDRGGYTAQPAAWAQQQQQPPSWASELYGHAGGDAVPTSGTAPADAWQLPGQESRQQESMLEAGYPQGQQGQPNAAGYTGYDPAALRRYSDDALPNANGQRPLLEEEAPQAVRLQHPVRPTTPKALERVDDWE